MPFAFTISAVIPASPQDIYDAWLDSQGHAQMTGSNAAKGSTTVGGEIEAWNGYISGRNTALTPGERIVQAWRTTEFTDADADSQIEVILVEAPGGTLVTLTHSNVPDGQTGYEGGWVDHYFNPMKTYFAARPKPAPAAKKKPAVKAKAKAKAKPKAKLAKEPAGKAAVKKTAKKAAKKATKKTATKKAAAKKPAAKRAAAKKPAAKKKPPLKKKASKKKPVRKKTRR